MSNCKCRVFSAVQLMLNYSYLFTSLQSIQEIHDGFINTHAHGSIDGLSLLINDMMSDCQQTADITELESLFLLLQGQCVVSRIVCRASSSMFPYLHRRWE